MAAGWCKSAGKVHALQTWNKIRIITLHTITCQSSMLSQQCDNTAKRQSSMQLKYELHARCDPPPDTVSQKLPSTANLKKLPLQRVKNKLHFQPAQTSTTTLTCTRHCWAPCLRQHLLQLIPGCLASPTACLLQLPQAIVSQQLPFSADLNRAPIPGFSVQDLICISSTSLPHRKP
jgi:hypothetical protein